MPIEHFLFALTKEGNYTFIKSHGVNQLISDVNIQYLRQKLQQPKDPYWLPTEQAVAIQLIDEVKDDYGRTGVWNHTLLIPIDEYIRLTNPYALFSKYFFKKDGEVPIRLEPIEVEATQ